MNESYLVNSAIKFAQKAKVEVQRGKSLISQSLELSGILGLSFFDFFVSHRFELATKVD
jgi:hypothetical protein